MTTYRAPSKNQRSQKRLPRSWLVISIVIITAAAIGVWVLFFRSTEPLKHSTADQTPQQTVVAEPEPEQPVFDKEQYSLNDPASLWIVVNKQRPLNPLNYSPADLTTPAVQTKYAAGSMESLLRQEAAAALEQMFQVAAADDVPLMLVSGYRSYSHQQNVFGNFVRSMGQAEAELISARPGHSEHQTGWAADVGAPNRQCEVETCFGDMPEGQWVTANAHRFGFIIRYPQQLTDVTGFDYEPWHLRYVGIDLASEMQRTNTVTLEQFFGLPAAPEY